MSSGDYIFYDPPCPPTTRSPEAVRSPPIDEVPISVEWDDEILILRESSWIVGECAIDMQERSKLLHVHGGDMTKAQAYAFARALIEAAERLAA